MIRPRAGVIGPVPGRALKAAGRAVRKRCVWGESVLQLLERGHNPVAQRLEPDAGAFLPGLDLAYVHGLSG